MSEEPGPQRLDLDARAHTGLAADPWLVENEPDRLKRLQDLATATISTPLG